MEIQNKIDTYLMGRMSEQELMSFENEMAKNPDLQAEVDFQKDIVSSIQDTKRLQLKQRLSSLETPAVTSFNFKPWAIGASILSLSVLGGLGIWEMNKEQNIPPTVEKTELITTNKSLVETENRIVATKEVPVVEKIVPKETVDNIVPTETNIEPITKNITPTEPIIVDPSNLLPNHIGIEDTEGIKNAGHENETINSLDNQEDTHINTNLINPKVIEKKNMFHYQYDGDKLTLIGDFKSDTYTVYELSQRKNTPLYLKFKNSFYFLNNNNGNTTKLELVKDQKILSELKSK